MTDPTGPPPSVDDLARLAALRRRATARLPGAAGSDAATAAARALVVLHTMASAPATATEALALLHELQVHQVELELQAQELRDDRAELEAALHRRTERYDHLPVGCVTLDADLVVRELNHCAARMIGIDRERAIGLPLAGLVAGESLAGLRAAAADVMRGRPPAACRLMLRAPHGPGRAVSARLGADPAGQGFLVALAEEPALPLPAGA